MTSLLDDLRAMATAIHANHRKELNVAGAGGRLAVRYRPPAREKCDAVLSAYMFGRALTADEELQLLVDCCDTVLRVDHEGRSVDYDDQGKLRFDDSDSRWAQMAVTFNEIEAELAEPGETPTRLKAPGSARECVALLFRLDAQPMAASSHAQTLVPWLQGINAEIAARVEGNSSSAGRPEPPSSTQPEKPSEPAA